MPISPDFADAIDHYLEVIMSKEIDVQAIAKECGFGVMTYTTGADSEAKPYLTCATDQLTAFANAILELAADRCEEEHVGDSVVDECDCGEDNSYNTALRHAASSIRSLKANGGKHGS
jgi:hypothetical protein